MTAQDTSLLITTIVLTLMKVLICFVFILDKHVVFLKKWNKNNVKSIFAKLILMHFARQTLGRSVNRYRMLLVLIILYLFCKSCYLGQGFPYTSLNDVKIIHPNFKTHIYGFKFYLDHQLLVKIRTFSQL